MPALGKPALMESFDYLSATSQYNGRGSIDSSGFSLITGLRGVGRALALTMSGFNTRTCVMPFDGGDIDVGTVCVHFRFECSGLPDSTNQEFLRIRTAAGSTVLNLVITTAGTLQVRRSTTVLLSLVNAFSVGVTAHFGIDCVIDSSAGSVEIYKDGLSVASVSGVNTLGASGNLHDLVFRSGLDASGDQFQIDDVYVTDDGYAGQVDVDTDPVDEDVSSAGWTPSTGASLEEVLDEVPGSESDYAVSSNDGDAMQFGVTPGLGAINPLAVQAIALARVETSSTSQLELVLHSGAANDGGVSHPLTTSLRAYGGVINAVDPNTTNAWDPTDLDSVELELTHVVPA